MPCPSWGNPLSSLCHVLGGESWSFSCHVYHQEISSLRVPCVMTLAGKAGVSHAISIMGKSLEFLVSCPWWGKLSFSCHVHHGEIPWVPCVMSLVGKTEFLMPCPSWGSPTPLCHVLGGASKSFSCHVHHGEVPPPCAMSLVGQARVSLAMSIMGKSHPLVPCPWWGKQEFLLPCPSWENPFHVLGTENLSFTCHVHHGEVPCVMSLMGKAEVSYAMSFFGKSFDWVPCVMSFIG